MYEWDENKRQTNLTNHGVDFAHMDAFEWESAVSIIDEDHAEPRWIGTGFIGAVLHVVVFTDRGEDIRSAAYVLMHALTEIGLGGTSWMNAQFNTLQHRFLKVAGKVCELNTIVRFHLPTSFPLKHLYDTILCNLAKACP